MRPDPGSQPHQPRCHGDTTTHPVSPDTANWVEGSGAGTALTPAQLLLCSATTIPVAKPSELQLCQGPAGCSPVAAVQTWHRSRSRGLAMPTLLLQPGSRWPFFLLGFCLPAGVQRNYFPLKRSPGMRRLGGLFRLAATVCNGDSIAVIFYFWHPLTDVKLQLEPMENTDGFSWATEHTHCVPSSRTAWHMPS